MNCYILIGGRSTRMGRSKAELFLERVAAAAAPVFDEVIAVDRLFGVRRLAAAFGLPKAAASRRTPKVIYDDGGGAPVFGVLRALEDADGPAFVLAVDYPAVTTSTLRSIRERFEASPAAIVAPVWRGTPQPLCAGYRPSVIPLIRRRLEERKLDLLGLLSEAAAETFVYEGSELMNVNTPAELEEVEKRR